MSDELDEFTSQLNNATQGGNPAAQQQPKQPQMTPQQAAMMQKMKQQQAEQAARPLLEQEIHGKVGLKYFGHAGFSISFKDEEDKHRCIYLNLCADNPQCPKEDKQLPPNDCDLALVSNGQLPMGAHATFLYNLSKKEGKQIICTSEVGMFFQMFRGIPATGFGKMQAGGTKDYKYAKVTMTHAESSSTCFGPNGVMMPGGNGVGFVVTIPNHNFKVYHAGDTALFSDMKIIDDLYQPDVALLPVGVINCMSPRDIAYALKHFLPTPKIIVPMHMASKGPNMDEEFDFEAIVAACKEMGVEGKEFIHPKDFFGGAALLK